MESEVKTVDKPHGEVMFWLHHCTEMMSQGIVKHPTPPEQKLIVCTRQLFRTAEGLPLTVLVLCFVPMCPLSMFPHTQQMSLMNRRLCVA